VEIHYTHPVPGLKINHNSLVRPMTRAWLFNTLCAYPAGTLVNRPQDKQIRLGSNMSNLLIGSSLLLAMCAGLPLWGQTAPAASGGSVSTSHVQAQLLNGIKAAKAKANDPVRAQTMTPLALADGTVIPVGSTLSGHVVKVEPDSPEHTSSIAITFESVELKKHQTVPLKLSIASAMAQAAAGMGNNTYQTATRSGSGVADSHALNGQAYSVKDDNTNLMTSNGAAPGQAVAAHTGSVIGLPGVTLMVEDGPNAVSTFISAKKNLQLDSGLQMILVVAP
jgi:hypothetical protein